MQRDHDLTHTDWRGPGRFTFGRAHKKTNLKSSLPGKGGKWQLHSNFIRHSWKLLMKTNDFPRVGDFTPECTSPLTAGPVVSGVVLQLGDQSEGLLLMLGLEFKIISRRDHCRWISHCNESFWGLSATSGSIVGGFTAALKFTVRIKCFPEECWWLS